MKPWNDRRVRDVFNRGRPVIPLTARVSIRVADIGVEM